MSFLRKWFHDEEGQSTTEYILILGLVVMIGMKFGSKLQKSLTGSGGMTDKLDQSFQRALSGNFEE